MSHVYEDRIARFRRNVPEKTNATHPEPTAPARSESVPARQAKKSYEEIGVELREYSKIHMQRFIEKKVRNRAPLVSRHGPDRPGDFAATAEFEIYFGIDAIKKCFYETEERLGIWYDPSKCPNAEPRAAENHGLEVPEWAKEIAARQAAERNLADNPQEMIPALEETTSMQPVSVQEDAVIPAAMPATQADELHVPVKPVRKQETKHPAGPVLKFHMTQQASADSNGQVRMSGKLDAETMDILSQISGKSSSEGIRTCLQSLFDRCPDENSLKAVYSYGNDAVKGSTKTVTFRLDAALASKLKQASEALGVSVSNLLRFAIRYFIGR